MKSSADRFFSKVVTGYGGSCWVWSGSTDACGYGRIWWGGRLSGAHRVSYELHRGKIADGMVIDHLCRNRACCNPDHLEVVTQRENWRRGLAPSVANSLATHCLRGHELSGPNLAMRSDGGRRCRECVRTRRRADVRTKARAREYYAKNRKRLLAEKRKYYERRCDSIRAYNRARYAAKREALVEYARKRRAEKRADLTASETRLR